MKRLLFVLCLLGMTHYVSAAENADIIVAQDGSGDFGNIQEAINSIPSNNSELQIILIKNGVYNEKIRIDTDFIALVGEDRDSTRIEYYEPYVWDSVYVEIGRAVLNIYADHITLANLTVENTFPLHDRHAFTVYGNGRLDHTIVVNCNIISQGSDTISLWSDRYYYHKDCYFEGLVDYVCPRGWCYLEDCEFYGYNTGASVWHDGDADPDMKFVIRNSNFDGVLKFGLGRYHMDSQFYLLDCYLTDNVNNNGGIIPTANVVSYWGDRVYYYNTLKENNQYDWHQDNLWEASNLPRPEEITPLWTFQGNWDPEETMPSVLEWAYMPKPKENREKVGLNPELRWIPGRNAESHDVYFGTINPPPFVVNTTDTTYTPATLEPNTTYYWQVNEKTEEGIVEGEIWAFKTYINAAPVKASNPFPPVDSTNIEGPLAKMTWSMDTHIVDTSSLYLGTHPDSLELVQVHSIGGYQPTHFVLGKTYYWRVDLSNQFGTAVGDVWNFSMRPASYDKADYVQGTDDNHIVVIEAEDFTNSTVVRDHEWTLVTEPTDFSGRGAMRALPDDGSFYNSKYSERSCQVDYAVNFTDPGTYYVWVRAYSTDGQDNYCHMGLNGLEVYDASRIGNFTATGQWEWLSTALNVTDRRTLAVNAIGIQGVNLWFGRDGIIVDKILLTTNPDYIPTDKEASTWTTVEDSKDVTPPAQFKLEQNYPNPFNPETTIEYTLAETGKTSLVVYDLLGRQVAELVSGVQQAGQHSVTWHVNENQIASGVYTAVLKVGRHMESIKLVYLK